MNDNISLDMEKIEREYPNLFREKFSILKGEINVCAVYDNIKNELIHNPTEEQYHTHEDTYVNNCFEIKIFLNRTADSQGLPLVRYLGKKIEKHDDNHMNEQGNCCLGIFEDGILDKLHTISNFIRNYVLPFFVWQAYKLYYKEIPPWGEYSHGDKGYAEYKKELKIN